MQSPRDVQPVASVVNKGAVALPRRHWWPVNGLRGKAPSGLVAQSVVVTPRLYLQEFLWRPLVEDGSMRVAAARWLGAGGPRLLVVGGGTWAMRRSNGSRAALAEYGAGVSRLAPLLERLAANGSTVLWALQGPVQPQRLRPGRQALTNELVDAYNRAAARALRHSPGVQLWRSARLVAQGAPEADSPDGLHAGPFVLGYVSGMCSAQGSLRH